MIRSAHVWARSTPDGNDSPSTFEIHQAMYTTLGLATTSGLENGRSPLDGVRDLLLEGATVFNPSKLGQIDELLMEAGSDIHRTMRPLVEEVSNHCPFMVYIAY